MVIIGIAKESLPERRVAQSPASVKELVGLGAKVLVEKGAGETLYFGDDDYQSAGAEVLTRAEVLGQAEILLGINFPDDWLPTNQNSIFIGMLNPLGEPERVQMIAERGITAFALELIPRTTRAQSMDVLSSMATVAGYAAVIEAAAQSPKLFPLLMTAAGSITPCKVLIIGAGVAGLQALATAKRLGGSIEVFDVRKAAKEEVKSLGGKFVDIEGAKEAAGAGGYAIEQSAEYQQKQRDTIHAKAVKADVIICTAQIPGKAAPLLIEERTIRAMKAGAVIVDLAAPTGGNAALSQPGKTIHVNGVTLMAPLNILNAKAADATQLYSKNLINLLKLAFNKGEFSIPWDDDIISSILICRDGKIVNARVLQTLQNQKVNA